MSRSTNTYTGTISRENGYQNRGKTKAITVAMTIRTIIKYRLRIWIRI